MTADRLFHGSIAVSFAAHAALIGFANRAPVSAPLPPLPIVVDLTKPMGGAAKLAAPKRLVPNAPPGPNVVTESQAVKPIPAVPTPTPEFTTAGPEIPKTEKLEDPAPTAGGAPGGTGTAAIPGGSGIGSDSGVPGGTGDGSGAADLVADAKLLNGDQVRANLRRFYPESERAVGREGVVTIVLNIGTDGRVSSVEVSQSAGPAFDQAAAAVAKLMRFSPGMTRAGPVAVRKSQRMQFRLED